MLFSHALLFSLLCTFVIAVPVDRTHPPYQVEEVPYKPDSRALVIPELVKNGIAHYKGAYYRDSPTGTGNDDVIEIDEHGNIFPYSLPAHTGNPLKPHSFPWGVNDARVRLVSTGWRLMPCTLNDIHHRNDHLTFTLTEDKQLKFHVEGKSDVTTQPESKTLPLKAVDNNEPPSGFGGEWYRELTSGLYQGFANDIVKINDKVVSIWEMSDRPGGIEWVSGYNKPVNFHPVNLWRLVGRWRRMPNTGLDTGKRNQVMVVTYGDSDGKLHYELGK